jgi:hypothetical protein
MNSKLLLLALLPLAAVASAQPLPSGGGLGASSGVATLFTYGNNTGVGNGADTTEDTLLTYNIPAGTLKANGDRLRIFVNGFFAASTDAKSARLRLNGSGLAQTVSGSTASTTTWTIYMEVQRSGSSQQQEAAYSLVNNGPIVVNSGPGTMTDTAAIVLTVTGQNTTTATANTAVVRYVAVEYLP